MGYLYVGWVEPESGYGGITKTILLNINTLQTIKTGLPTYDNSSFTSSDNQFIYQYGGSDSLGVWHMLKYSVQTDLLIEDINLSELFPNIEYPVFEDGSNGKGLFGYNRIMSDSNTCEYVIYDFDNEMFTQEIACPYRCYGRFISNGNYFLLENVLWDESKPNAEYSSGRINIYETSTSSLAKILTLPSDGKLLLFDNYPNDIYYVIDIEKPTRQIYSLKMDSIFNVLDLTSLNPSSAIVNSSSFTLTVNGHGFDTLSTVYFNDTAKTTTFVSDSVLTAEISATDISIVGSYPVWATDEWGTSDTLMFTIVPQTPYLSKISPSLALPYDVFAKKSSFNVMVIGNNFTTSSVAYFNGVAKTTTYISDSLITFQLSSGDVGTTEKTVSVWIQNSNQFSDTLLFNVVTTLPNQITPILECVTENGTNSYTSYFGYNNYNSEDVLVPLGTKNNISSQFSGINGSPVNIFIPGRQTNVFSIDFNGQEILWQLNGSSVSASSKSPPCP